MAAQASAVMQVRDVVDAQHLGQVRRDHRIRRYPRARERARRGGGRHRDAGRTPSACPQLGSLPRGEPVAEQLMAVLMAELGLVDRRPQHGRDVRS
jgi:hypothetical protein